MTQAMIGRVTRREFGAGKFRKWHCNCDWLKSGKECGPGFSSRLWGGALRDETNNGCVGDYRTVGPNPKR